MEIKSVALIGMPGTGKTTIGRLLSVYLGMKFVDTDALIEDFEGFTLNQILCRSGYQRLREIEEQVILEADLKRCVIATGGSAVYGEKAMSRLAEFADIVYLHCDADVLTSRLGGADAESLYARGVAVPESQSFAQIFLERSQLYQRYADYQISSDKDQPSMVAKDVIGILGK